MQSKAQKEKEKEIANGTSSKMYLKGRRGDQPRIFMLSGEEQGEMKGSIVKLKDPINATILRYGWSI